MVPCGAQGAELAVSGAVPCPGRCASGAMQCPRCCAVARAASVSQSEVEPLPPPHSPRSQAPLTRITFAMTGAATPALPSSARLC